MSDMTCDRLKELAPELALGVLPAQERARAVAHLDRCPGCREYVEQLTLVGDGLLGLLPGTEPPVGFETRVVNRLSPSRLPPSRPAPPRRLRLRLRVAAAAAALACAFGFGGWAVGTALDDDPAPSTAQDQRHPALLQAALVADGREVGRIFAYPGSPGWVYMSVDLVGLEEGADGKVHCRLERSDGTTVPVGSFTLKGGYGYWGAPAPVDAATVSGAQLLAADGSVLATAHFPPRNAPS
ncbi:zf-HC2 domain-containing protein [Streptomyces sp. ISL-98]|uniref:zf-HC2 domain-containing protein n=1 Tax=Streptomyces sp. ISL-98 TaxID=2819192 RepID=UPI001BE6F1E2|nr:zf-HC2 domain-containing protein [Streptomyces sp. ISL-98]MBT2509039.1 zf-HC2 domain-containing protein [Streptomyces sp. ISL-98]